jgi:hypothetical protein
LDDAQTEFGEQMDIPQVVPEANRVLPSQEDAHFAIRFAALNIARLVDLSNHVAVGSKP